MVFDDGFNKVSDLLLGFFHDLRVVLLDVSGEKVVNIDGAPEPLFGNVRRDFDFNGFKLFFQLFEFMVAKFFSSDETENSLWFKFS